MQSFIYTYSEVSKRNQHTQKTVRMYRLVRGVPKLVATLTDTFVGEFQLVMLCAEKYKLFPKKAFERTQSGGYKFYYPDSLRDHGLVNINGVR